MDTLNRWQKKIDKIDVNILMLFEQRMGILRRSAQYKKRHGIKLDKKSDGGVIEKVTKNACDTEVIAYTEGLFDYLHNVSLKYQCGVMKKA